MTDVPMSKCDRCGARFPSAPVGTIHKCQCSGGMMVPEDADMLDSIRANAKYQPGIDDMISDNRPANCRERLRDEGKPYPKSGVRWRVAPVSSR